MKKQLLWVTLMLLSVMGFTSMVHAQDAVTANPYAYGLSSGFDAASATLTVKYSLNAPAVAVSIDVYNGKDLAKSFPVDATGLTAGEHSIAVSTADLPQGVALGWKVKVTGATLTAPAIVTSELYKFFSPYGITVDNNPTSANFGRVLVTETQMNIPATGYFTSSGNGGVGCGVYAFDPQMKGVKNINGGYGFTGGVTFTDGIYPGTTSTHLYGFKRLAASEDGRIFVSNADMTHSPIFEIDPTNLNTAFTPIFSGTPDANGIFSDATNPFIAGPNAAMAVTGKGADLKIAALSCKGGFVFAVGNYFTDVYNLGTAKSWSSAPSSSIEALTGQYTVSPQGVNLLYDDKGGIFYAQYRATPKASEPAIKHFTAAGVEDYSDISTVVRGGGIAYNMDKSLLAIPSGNGYIGFYTVSTDTEGKLVLTQKYKTPDMTTTFRGQNAMAFDYAGNVYTCDNGKEFFGRIAMPREDPNAITPAADSYAFTIPVPEPVSPYSLTQDWAITTGLTGAADVRQGVCKSGTWYIQNKTTGKIEIWTKDGKSEKTLDSALSWPAICTDDAGNIVVRIDATWPSAMATDVPQFKIYSADLSTSTDLKIDFAGASLDALPRMDFVGHARGNLLSAEGGVLYLAKNTTKQIYNIPVASGVQDVNNTFAYEGPTDLNNTATVYAKGDNELIVCQRNMGNTYYKSTIEGESLTSELLVTPDKYSLNGCGLFTLGGKDYIVYGTDNTYLDGFAVALVSTDANNQILAKHASQLASKGANNFQGNWFGAEAISDTQAKIYQYFPGGLIAEYTFTAPEPEVTVPTLKQEWISTNVPAAGDTRQGIVKDGKWYIQNKATQQVEVWTKDGKSSTESYPSAGGSGICKDEAGNMIIAPAFANTTVGYSSVTVIPADGSTPKVVTLSNMPIGRGDFFGYAKGNVLSADGGKLYYTTGDASANKNVYVVSIANGVQDADNSFSVAVSAMAANTSTAIYSFKTADGEEHLTIAPRGAAASYFDATWNGEELNTTPLQMPGKHSLNGCAPFVMGGKNYVVYPTSTSSKYLDGFSIAEYSTDAANKELVRHEETLASPANSFQADWFQVEVVSDTKANIYQYYPDGYFAMYTFKMPVPAPEVKKVYLVGQFDENAAGWAANAGVEMTPTATAGVYTTNMTNSHNGMISVVTKLGATASDWDTMNANRFGPETDATALVNATVTPMTNNATAWALPKLGKYAIEVNLNDKTIKATLTEEIASPMPDKIYVIGNIPNVGWDPSVGTVTLEKTGVAGEYTGTFNVVESEAGSGIAYIGFSKILGTNNTDWTTFNSGRFGSTTNNEKLEQNTAKEFRVLGDKTYTINAPATVTVKANLNDNTITLVTFTGVEGVDGSIVKVIAGVGEIKVVGDVKSIEVYNAGGALISKDETTINCASGLYLVKVNGKSVKVVVR